MISFTELKRSIFGAWLLAGFDQNGLLFFENSLSAFWRSYWAALLAAPAYITLVIIRASDSIYAVTPVSVIAIQTSGYIIGWFAMPFVMLYVCRFIDKEDQFLKYFIAYNWATLLQVTLIFVIAILAKFGAFPPILSGFLTFIGIMGVLVYQGFIARVALIIPNAGAFGVVALDLMISLLVESGTTKLLLGHRLFGG